MRLERDSMGELEVPANAYYGANTRRAELNFPISELRLSRSFVKAIGLIKQCAAVVNLDLGEIDEHIANAIVTAAQRVIDGEFDDQFVVDVFQTGSGTRLGNAMQRGIQCLDYIFRCFGQQRTVPDQFIGAAGARITR